MHKKGQMLGELLPLVWRVLLFMVVVLVISLSIGNAFSAKQDVRGAEAVILTKTVVDCIAPESKLKADFNLRDCLTLDEREYYLNVIGKSSESNFSVNKTLGMENFKTLCEVGSEKPEAGVPLSCLEQKYYILVDNNGKTERGVLEILVGIAKISENV
ncbi:hypothetical protein ACFLZZ_02125 [Nanoarchaeota archaeon]